MAKLYIFSIGGTGSRVLKSLAMMLASGAHQGSAFDTIVPIILDPDVSNGDLERTQDILMKYQFLQNYAQRDGDEDDNFFGLKIRTLDQLSNDMNTSVSNHFRFQFGQKTDGSFMDYIHYNGLNQNNQGLIDLLFSKKTLNSNMEVGFKGNPNMGSIVLNQFAESKEFDMFYSTFSRGDAVFIISSIFGGTGAAGFPLLMKNLRDEQADNPFASNNPEVSQSVIGAVSLLPYFKVNPDENSQINSTTFLQKTKAALSYYSGNVTGKNGVDYFYYLGDQESENSYANEEGGKNQRNDAHFLELSAALSIIDFMHIYSNASKPEVTQVKEFGIASEGGSSLHFDDLGPETFRRVVPNLSRLFLMNLYMEHGFGARKTRKVQWQQPQNGGISLKKLDGQYRDALYGFLAHLRQWLKEMKDNNVAFAPFHMERNFSNALQFIVNHPPEKKGVGQPPESLKLLDEYNIKHFPPIKKGYQSAETKLLKLFESSTKELIRNHIKLS